MTPEILLVDDEPEIRSCLARFLQDEGCFVTPAGDVPTALKLLEAFEYDLVISDIFLRDGTGIDILRQVRCRPNACPVVMITGSPMIESASEALRLGAFDYISKPVLREGIIHVVRKALEYHRVTREVERYQSDLEAIFSSVQDAIISFDENLAIVNYNAAAASLCGLSGAAQGSVFGELPCGKVCRGALETAIFTKKAAEGRYLKCDGGRNEDERYISVSAAPLKLANQQVRGAVLVVRDETSLFRLEKRQPPLPSFAGLIGKSAAMQHIYRMIERLAELPSTVLIMGENGTGKELVAQALHDCGKGERRPLVKVNCAALSENLLESELFGHVRGSFTGAVRDKAGLFEKADGGTLFLDEIGEISAAMQVKLLRVLQEQEFERVGGDTPIRVKVRVITATNKDLAREVQERRFRQDLYYRLKVVELVVPPLRERSEDVLQLVDYFIHSLNGRLSTSVTGVSDEVLRIFRDYSWPGNVRELEHALEHALVMCAGNTVLPEHLPGDLAKYRQEPETSPEDRIRTALEATAGNKAKAARMLKMDRKTLYRKLHELGLN
ncbi:sigma-54-dependent Fis family transcriptional regulator [Geomonas limicola]|uniref:Sigma-54-dependent Fis family transcriptional regulator n=1 Tax=Geomonas limicola TaxID=2740186 RepID=A0A6V8N3C6_9BACT|nr:sigma-54 dependent transcriptional regulator [Geomonas limicola]GFO67055.1 sigma-54-dependent Fis family transcriptional regulator [Geomonas limicola]